MVVVKQKCNIASKRKRQQAAASCHSSKGRNERVYFLDFASLF